MASDNFFKRFKTGTFVAVTLHNELHINCNVSLWTRWSTYSTFMDLRETMYVIIAWFYLFPWGGLAAGVWCMVWDGLNRGQSEYAHLDVYCTRANILQNTALIVYVFPYSCIQDLLLWSNFSSCCWPHWRSFLRPDPHSKPVCYTNRFCAGSGTAARTSCWVHAHDG